MDAVVECNEMALRDFVQRASQAPTTAGFVMAQSQTHGIWVHDVDLKTLPHRMAQLYILSVYEQMEGFFASFCQQHPASASWEQRNKTTWLEYLKPKLSSTHGVDHLLGPLQCDIHRYYRLLRNRFMHPERRENDIETLWQSLDGRSAQIRAAYRNTRPNRITELSFDDFVLFTKVCKDLALGLCYAADLTAAQIAELICRRSEDPEDGLSLAKVSRIRNAPDRQRRALRRMVADEFGICTSAEVDSVVAALLDNGLLAQR